jgi:hypothetical protein
VVGTGLRLQHTLRAQPRAQALQHLVPTVTAQHFIGQQAAGAAAQGLGFQTAQPQIQHRGGQGNTCQVLAQQPLQVVHVQRGFGRAQYQFTFAGGVAAFVHLPAQTQRQHTTLARAQPHLQLVQQTPRREQQGRRRLDLGRQFQRTIKHLGQHQPGVELGLQTIRAVQRIEQ